MSENESHFDGRRYLNPGRVGERTLGDLFRLMRTPRAQWPRSVAVTTVRPQRPPAGELHVTFVGHSTFLLQTDSLTILTDPLFSDRTSPLSFLGPRRVRSPAIRLEDVPSVDVILLSHNHYDHCDL